MNAADIMTQPVITASPETKIAEVARLMLQHRISGLPVIDKDNRIMGILTEGDLLRRSELGTDRHRARWVELLIGPGRLAHDYVEAHARTAGEVMSADVAYVSPIDNLPDVVRVMEKRHIKRVPVVENGRLVGIISRANLVRALVHAMSRTAAIDAASPQTDSEIRDRIVAEIARQPWGPRFSVDVSVKNGVVQIDGSITDDRERVALRVLAETVAGVKAVRDHLVWVEPISGFVVPS